MKFHANPCVAIHTQDLKGAHAFYSGVLGLKLLSRSRSHLEYKLGKIRFYVNRDAYDCPPIPSFTVKNLTKAKARLTANGAKIIQDRGRSLYFQDPLGFIFDLVEK